MGALAVVGGKVLVVHHNYRAEPSYSWATVIKVGRRWAEIQYDNRTWRAKTDRFDIADEHLDGGEFTSPGKVYADEAAYLAARRTKALWQEFYEKIRGLYTKPDNLTDKDILIAADVLRIRLRSE